MPCAPVVLHEIRRHQDFFGLMFVCASFSVVKIVATISMKGRSTENFLKNYIVRWLVMLRPVFRLHGLR